PERKKKPAPKRGPVCCLPRVLAASGRGVLDEFLRRRLAPLRIERLVRRQAVRAVMDVQHVAVGPMLVHAAPRIGPIVEHLAAKHVAADAPHMLVLAFLDEVFVADHHVVEILHLERQVIEADLLALDAEEDMVIDVIIAAIAAIERADEMIGRSGPDIVRADEAQRLAEPFERAGQIRCRHHAVADALHLRGALLQAAEIADAAIFLRAPIDDVGPHRKRVDLLDAPDHFDLIAIGLAQPHPLAAAGLVDRFNRRGAWNAGNLLEVFLALRIIGKADEAGRTELGDMQMMLGIGPAHEQSVLRPPGPNHAEIEQKLFLLVEVGGPDPSPGDVSDFDDRHVAPSVQKPFARRIPPKPRGGYTSRRVRARRQASSAALNPWARLRRSGVLRKAPRGKRFPWEARNSRFCPSARSSKTTRSQNGSKRQRRSSPRIPTRSTSSARSVRRTVSLCRALR